MSSQDANACPRVTAGGRHGRVHFARIKGDRGDCRRGRVDLARRRVQQLEFLEQLSAGRRGQLILPRRAAAAPPRPRRTGPRPRRPPQGGGMDALIAAAKKEGQLNVITLPADWANYGTIMKDFTAKYGIKITDANPDGSSQDELNAIKQTKGQSRAPDVVDVGTAFAVKGQTAGDWAPVPGRDLERHPGRVQGGERPVLRRLRRLRGHRLRQLPGEERRRPRSSRCSPARTRTWSR